jgi:putative hydrolase of the HAD superfamily
MTAAIDWVLFDVGGVLGTNAWDREQRAEAVAKFGLDGDDFQYRHEEMVGAFESGEVTLDEYLAITVFCAPRGFSAGDFKKFMFAQSVAWPDSIGVARELAGSGKVRLATLNNESEELNRFRIELFGLREVFPTFFTSCWLGVRKPTRHVYERVLGMTQADPGRTLFVDDRLQNLAPAASLGIRTVQFTNAEKLRADLKGLALLG